MITGTDTGVGKTMVATALITAWRGRGHRVAAQKPAESGCAPNARGELMPLDAIQLADAAGCPDALADVCPFRYAAAVAPAVAARAEGRPFEIAGIHAARARLPAHDLLVVEGAGGLLVPYADDLLGADLAHALGARLLIVARAGLGTINHTALTVEAARARGLDVIGVVLSRGSRPADPSEADNAAEISRIAAVRVWGTLPHVAPYDPDRAARALAAALDVDALWAAAVVGTPA